MKNLVCLIASMAIGMGTATANVEHTVARGESIESIANKYHITPQALIKANPGLDSLFYIGMKINIPEEAVEHNANDDSSDSISSAYNMVSVETEIPHNVKDKKEPNSEETEGSGIEVALRLSYGFIPKPEGLSQSPWAFAAAVGANYWFTEKLVGPFAGAMIGYDSASSTSYMSDCEIKTSSHFISIPISAGYALSVINKKFSITPYVGFSPKFCVKASGETKIHGESIKYDGDKEFAIDLSYGVSLRTMGLNIIGAFSTPLNDAQKGYFGDKTYFSIGIGFGL